MYPDYNVSDSWYKHIPLLHRTLVERSWYVNVFDRQYGYLGLFRQSRETGLWFQGKHNVHIKGNLGRS